MFLQQRDLSFAVQEYRKAITCISYCSNYEVKALTEKGDEITTSADIKRRFMDLNCAYGQEQIKAGQFEEGLNSLRAAMSMAEQVQHEKYKTVIRPGNQQILKNTLDAYIGLKLFADAINLLSQKIQELRTLLLPDLEDSLQRSISKYLAELYAMRAEIVFNHLRSKIFLVNSDIQYALELDPYQPAAKRLSIKLQTYGQRLCARSQFLSSIGRPEDAQVLVTKAAELKTLSVPLRLAEAKAHCAAGQLTEALEDLMNLVQDPTFPAANELATGLKAETAKELACTLDSLDANDFYRCRSFANLDYYSKTLEVPPEDLKLCTLKEADCLFARGQTLEAIRLYHQMRSVLAGEASLTARRTEAYVGRRICLAWQDLARKASAARDWERALECLSRSLLFAADCPAPWIERAGLNFLFRRKREAVQDTRTALSLLLRMRASGGLHKQQRSKLKSLFSTFCPNFGRLSI
ncbi:hypothetical protein SprV_0200832200 [Sparganum proliferum]